MATVPANAVTLTRTIRPPRGCQPVDHPDLCRGWWCVERDGQIISRWTDGEVMLSLPEMNGIVTLEIHLAGSMIYAVDAAPKVRLTLAVTFSLPAARVAGQHLRLPAVLPIRSDRLHRRLAGLPAVRLAANAYHRLPRAGLRRGRHHERQGRTGALYLSSPLASRLRPCMLICRTRGHAARWFVRGPAARASQRSRSQCRQRSVPAPTGTYGRFRFNGIGRLALLPLFPTSGGAAWIAALQVRWPAAG
jgi:hypothetical protein